MAEVRLLGERVEEGERKRGWRKRKEENGVQAPNRAEIILDHKGWNSRKSKDILRIANRLWRRERGEMNKTLEPRVRSKFLSLMMAARVVRSNLFSLMMAASTSQLDLSRKKSQWHIVINFFSEKHKLPVNVMEEQLEDVGRRSPMRRCEVEESWRRTDMCCVWHCLYIP